MTIRGDPDRLHQCPGNSGDMIGQSSSGFQIQPDTCCDFSIFSLQRYNLSNVNPSNLSLATKVHVVVHVILRRYVVLTDEEVKTGYISVRGIPGTWSVKVLVVSKSNRILVVIFRFFFCNALTSLTSLTCNQSARDIKEVCSVNIRGDQDQLHQ